MISPKLLIKFKLKPNGVTGDLLNKLINFLKERKKKVVLSAQKNTGQ